MSIAQTLAAFAGKDKIVVIRKPFVRWTGSIEAAMLLDQTLFWWETAGFAPFYKSDEDWSDDLPGLSRYAIRKARERLQEMGVLVVATGRHPSLPSTVTWYDIDRAALDSSFAEWAGFNSRLSEIEQLTDRASESEQSTVRNQTVDDPSSNSRPSESGQSYKEEASPTASPTASQTAAACSAPERERPAAALSQYELGDAQSSAAGETNVVDAMLDAFLAAMQTDLAALPEKVALEVVRHAARAVELGHHADDVDPAVRAWRRNLEGGGRRHAVRPPRSGQVLDALVKWAATAPPVPLLHPTEIIAPALDLSLLWTQPEPTPPTAAEQLWSRVLADLRLQMTTATYNAWLRDTRAVSLDDDALVIEVPTPAHRDWLTNRLGDALRTTFDRVADDTAADMRLIVAGAIEATIEATVPA